MTKKSTRVLTLSIALLLVLGAAWLWREVLPAALWLRPVIGVSLNFPLQLNRQKAAVREAQAKERHATARLEEQRAQVFFEVSQATENVRENAHVVQLYAASIVPTAEENLTAARSDYETGITDFLTLLTAEKALMLAELSYHQALANYHTGRTQLERAVGLPVEDLENLEAVKDVKDVKDVEVRP